MEAKFTSCSQLCSKLSMDLTLHNENNVKTFSHDKTIKFSAASNCYYPDGCVLWWKFYMIEDYLNTFVCVNQESKMLVHRTILKQTGIIQCLKINAVPTFDGKNESTLTIGIDHCLDLYKTLTIPICKSEETFQVSTSISTGKKSATMAKDDRNISIYIISIAGAVGATLFLFVCVTCLVNSHCKKSRNSNMDRKEESVTYNPMYGIDQAQDYGDYYMESRLEESNPNYDAYYKDCYTSNITNDNNLYGKGEN